MPSAIGRDFDERLRWIRKAFPTKGKVTVRTKRLVLMGGVRVQGVAWNLEGKDSIIEIERGPLAVCTDTLIHEWAHVLQHEEQDYSPDPVEQHNELWGQIYARIYRGFLEAYP